MMLVAEIIVFLLLILVVGTASVFPVWFDIRREKREKAEEAAVRDGAG